MNTRRTVILIMAVVIGAVAAVGLLSYVRNAESNADEAAAPVEIWFVQQPIPKGTPIDLALEQGLVGLEETAQRYRPATAVNDPLAELGGLVAITDLPADVPLVTGLFASAAVVNTGITDRLEEKGLVTVTFTVDQSRGAAYLIEPGDFVNVMIERDWDTPFFEEDPPIEVTDQALAQLSENLEETDSIRPILTDLYPVDSRVVYQKAEVLAVGAELVPDIGQTAGSGGADGDAQAQAQANRGLITLAVPPEAVQVILNVGRDNIYLSLVPDDYEPRPLSPLDPTSQVLPGESDGTLTPYDGYDGVINPGTAADDLAFTGDDRIGTTPSSGSGGGDGDDADGDTDGTTSSSGGSGAGRQETTTTSTPDSDGEGDESTTTTEAEGL